MLHCKLAVQSLPKVESALPVSGQSESFLHPNQHLCLFSGHTCAVCTLTTQRGCWMSRWHSTGRRDPPCKNCALVADFFESVKPRAFCVFPVQKLLKKSHNLFGENTIRRVAGLVHPLPPSEDTIYNLYPHLVYHLVAPN